MAVIFDKEGNMYAVPIDSFKHLSSDIADNELKVDISNTKVIQENKSEAPTKESNSNEFSGYYFERGSPDLKKLLENLEIKKTPWVLKEFGDKAFLVKRQDVKAIDLCFQEDPSLKNLEINDSPKLTPTKGAGTVILSMNQTEVYEQYGSEFLTFALEGVNVIAYNNCGKGLSQGLTDNKTVNSAIDCVYQYVSEHLKVPDEKILAKGQCFGGAPTAWLGRKHPNINVMIDQSPANFHTVATKVLKKKLRLSEVSESEEKGNKTDKFKIAYAVNYLIDGFAKAILGGYDTPENLSHNKGHKLIHHNIKNAYGSGGDQLVSDAHIERMTENVGETEGKISSMSFNPGGVHVSHWFSNPTSYEMVMNFMHRTGMTSDIY